MLKGEYTVGIYPSQKFLSRLLEGFQYLSLCVDILAQGKIQNSHSPFYSMFCTTLNYVH
jgi:hypothetical protein